MSLGFWVESLLLGLSFKSDLCYLQVPVERWDLDYAKRSSEWISQSFGAFIHGVHLFDESLFGISRSEAAFMDPQQRVLLECAYKTIGQFHGDLSSCSVAVGVSYNEYFLNLLSLDSNALIATSGTLSVLSGRVSYIFDLGGPSKSIDTACSSSLVCVHLSITSSLATGSTNALACGINLLLRHETSWVLASARMLSMDGRCKTMDSRADGYGRAEGCVVHHLTHGKAIQGANIAVTVAGTAVGQDGRSSSLTAPNGPAQQKVIRAALKAGSKTSKHVDTIEMHGTGTALGDPIEIGALCAVFEENIILRLQAIKSSSLHGEPAAGAIGMMNGIEGMTGEITTSVFVGLTHLNPYVVRALNAMKQRDLHVPRVPGPVTSCNNDGWKSVGVSSFAFQGTNTHIILDTASMKANMRNNAPNLPLQCESAWWTIVNVPIFSRFDQKGHDNSIVYTGSITSNDKWILHRGLDRDRPHTSRVPAVMIASLAANICHQMTSMQVSIANLILSWVEWNDNDLLNLYLDSKSSLIAVELLKSTENQRPAVFKGGMVKPAKDCLEIPTTLSRGLVSPYIINHIERDLPLYSHIEYHCNDIKVGHSSMRSDIVSEVAIQTLTGSKPNQGNLTVEQFHKSEQNIRSHGMFLCSVITLSDCCHITSGVWLKGIQECSETSCRQEQITIPVVNIARETITRQQSEVLDVVKSVFKNLVGSDEEFMHFGDIGIDSISSLELRRSLETTFQTQFPATLIFDYPDISSLSSYIYRHVSGQSSHMVGRRQIKSQEYPNSAVVLSMAGICSGCRNETELMGILGENKDRCSQIPPNRWDLSTFSTQSPYYQSTLLLGCWVNEIERFDSDLMKINEKESVWLDPQVKVLLEAICGAVIPQLSGDLKSSLWGAYIGCVWTEFPAYLRETISTKDISHLTGSGLNFSSGRVSFVFDFKGPCIGVDTACSSSLVALHMAHNSLENGAIDYGLSGGTNLMLLPGTSLNLASLGSLSASGRCKTLDADADGYSRGEGCVALVTSLKREDVSILAYLKGSACNQDGKSSSLTAPNGPSQSILVTRTLQQGAVSENEISYINLHGTGTALGDPIEVGALSNVFQSPGLHHQLVSLKSSIGHTEGSAGLHGVSGAMLCLSKNQNPSFHTLRNMNTYIQQILNGSKSVFNCSRQASGVISGPTTSSTVSSYGMSGTNACSVLQNIDENSTSCQTMCWTRKISWPCVLVTNFKYQQKFSKKSLLSVECLLGPDTAYLADHTVAGRSIVPGAGMFWISLSCIWKCLLCPRACLVSAAITSPIEIAEDLKVLGLYTDLSAGEVKIGRSFTSKIAQASTTSIWNKKNNSWKFESLRLRSEVYQPASSANISISREARYPAVLDCSIHLAPATAFIPGVRSEPRGVVAVEIFALSRRLSNSVSPVVQRDSKEGSIFTHHWGLTSSKHSSIHHKIFNLESKKLSMRSKRSEEGVIRYAVLHQADSAYRQDFLLHSDISMSLTVESLNNSMTINPTSKGSLHARTISWLTEVMHGSLAGKPIGQNIWLSAVSDIPDRLQLGSGKYSYDLKAMKSFIGVVGNEFINVKSRVLTLGKSSDISLEECQRIPTVEDISLQDGVINRPVLVHENSPSKKYATVGEIFMTGGMGALGTLILEWVVSESTVGGSFLGRSGRISSISGNPAINTDLSTSLIVFIKADSSKEDDSTRALSFNNSAPDIIMHAGGILDSKMVANISLRSIQNVYASKVSILRTLARHLMKIPVQTCQLFSSLAAFGGIRGQSVYASANAVLDAFGDEHSSFGIPIVSVQWGNWGGKGMAADDHTFVDIMQKMGLGMIQPATGLRNVLMLLFERMGRSDTQQFSTVLVNIFFWDKIKDTLKGDVPSILSDMIFMTQSNTRTKTSIVKKHYRVGSRTNDTSKVLENLVDLVQSLGLEIGVGDDLMSGGLGSLSLTSFVSSIHDTFNVSISPADVFNFSNLRQMSAFIENQIGENEDCMPPNSDDQHEVIDAIIEMVSAKLGMTIGSEEPLLASGLNSISVTELTSAISEHFGVVFTETDLIDHPTIRDVSEYLTATQQEEIEHPPTINLPIKVKEMDNGLSLFSLSYTYPWDSNNDICRISLAQEPEFDNVRNVPLNRWDKNQIFGMYNGSGMMTKSFTILLYSNHYEHIFLM